MKREIVINGLSFLVLFTCLGLEGSSGALHQEIRRDVWLSFLWLLSHHVTVVEGDATKPGTESEVLMSRVNGRNFFLDKNQVS
jgi:hypothetical protein